jgi:Domain of unknown function (DUF4129)
VASAPPPRRLAALLAGAALLALVGPAAGGPPPPARAAKTARGGVAVPAADLPAPSRDPEQVRRAVRAVLAKPEYRAVRRSLPQLLVDWLLERLGLLLAALSGTGAGSLLGIGVLLVVLSAVGVLVARFARGLTADPTAAAALGGPPGRPAADWRAEAAAHERAGAWRQAVRCRYRALVADLAARGLVEEVPGRTAGEYRGEVGRSAPAAAADFAGATELFERAWYGGRPTGADDAARLRALAERVLQLGRR